MIELSEIKSLVGKTAFDALGKDERFGDIRIEAMKLINGIAGTSLEPEGARPQSLDWSVLPFAWIAEYLAIAHFQNISPDYLQQAKFKYQEACNTAKSNAIGKRAGKAASVGEIEGACKL